MPTTSKKHVVIVGAGLVGALNGCFFAKRGYHVDLFEMRTDIRTQTVAKGKSINLALSCRGRDALKAVGLEDRIVTNGIPMYGRMIHDLHGNRRPIYYGRKNQYIMSIDRRRLNELLLTGAEAYTNMEIHFQHSLSSCDFDKKEATFINGQGEKVTVSYDLIVGCDGAHSAVRRQMMKSTLLNYSQEYIPHGYIEMSIPATKDGQFLIEENYLHIWPRNTFMMIGLPNTEDHTFVITLFMPFVKYESIQNEHDLLTFFETEFPTAVPLLGRENLVKTFFSTKPLPVITVKCSPYHIGDAAVIMGDAAHAMVPFYGQGMNCGFEDCLVFESILDQCGDDFAKALPEFTRLRNDDAKAICDLAMYNYIEMRASVNTRLFLVRKKLDNALNWLLPQIWIPLYTTVSFTRIPYRQCIENKRWQDKVLLVVVSLTGVATLTLATSTVWLRFHSSEILSGSWMQQLSALFQLKT